MNNTNNTTNSHANINTTPQPSSGPIYTMSYLHLSSLRDSIDEDQTPLYPQLQQPANSAHQSYPDYTPPLTQLGQYYTVTTRSEDYQPPPPRPDLPPLYSHVMQSRTPSALTTQYNQYLSHYQHNQSLLQGPAARGQVPQVPARTDRGDAPHSTRQ